jgi:hypothetical protein
MDHQPSLPKRRISFKGAWETLPGRRIQAVVLSGHVNRSPGKCVHLVFDDGSYFEIYSCCADLAGSSRLYAGNLFDVVHYVREHDEVMVHRNPPP